MNELETAKTCYHSRRDRRSHPDGSFDGKSRWTPSDAERRPCCDAIRSPSAAYPYSLMLHCRTVGHIAALHDVAESDLRREINAGRPKRTIHREIRYKLAARSNGHVCSIFDASTQYAIGRTLRQRVEERHGGGYYTYATPQLAARAELPTDSELLPAPRLVIECEVWGRRIEYGTGKTAHTYLRPLRYLPVRHGTAARRQDWGSRVSRRIEIINNKYKLYDLNVPFSEFRPAWLKPLTEKMFAAL